MNQALDEIRLTKFSHGAGCGCKIAPNVLEEILKNKYKIINPRLIVGNDSRDDAAVYDLENGTALISTTDFFMPIVDDPFDFGRIAAANAISDVYAMGGKPIMALAVLGWPVQKLSPSIAQRVIEGGTAVCEEAGIPLAGGHSIDSPEPIFGLSVNGLIDLVNLKRNDTAKEGDLIFLTKPIGVGIFSTALKRGVLKEEHFRPLISQLSTLNRIGEELGKLPGVTAMTDVTGFGLIGHLIEMTEGSGLSAELHYVAVPKLKGVEDYIQQRIGPDATFRNWNSYSEKVEFDKGINEMEAVSLLPDPQTNGGLLFAANKIRLEAVRALFKKNGLAEFGEPIGRMIQKKGKIIYVK